MVRSVIEGGLTKAAAALRRDCLIAANYRNYQ
jgi:hypothetical protein